MAIRTQKMTASEFLAQPVSNLPHELINGEEIMSPSPTVIHQRLVRLVFKLLERSIPNGEVFFAPLDVYWTKKMLFNLMYYGLPRTIPIFSLRINAWLERRILPSRYSLPAQRFVTKKLNSASMKSLEFGSTG